MIYLAPKDKPVVPKEDKDAPGKEEEKVDTYVFQIGDEFIVKKEINGIEEIFAKYKIQI